MFPRIFLPLFLLAALTCSAQVPFHTMLDTAEMREIRLKKIHREYWLDLRFDSITGKPLNAVDTTWTEYDRMGRETGFCYRDDDGVRNYSRTWINGKGQVVRRFYYDEDSTNGFIDYWIYNGKGQVTREITYTREGRKETPFNTIVFEYNASGQVIRQKEFFIDDLGKRKLDGTSQFYYLSNDRTVEVKLNENGKPEYRDTSGGFNSDGPYWSRYYRCFPGSNKQILLSDLSGRIDTMGNRIREISRSRDYRYEDGKLLTDESDTLYYDLHSNVLESRDARYVKLYFYGPDGSFDYSMTYNRRMQPLSRRTEAFEYYK